VAANFRHQKELLSIITGLAPEELHFSRLRESFPRILLPPFSGRFFGFKVLAKIGLPTFMRITNFHAPAIFYAVFYGHFMRWMRSAEENNNNLGSLIN